MSTRVRYVVKSPDGAYRGEHRGAAIGFGWVTDPLAAAFMSKPDAAGCVAHMNRIAQPEHRGYTVERIEVPLVEQTARVRDAESEVTRLRAALAEIAALQTEEPTARPNTDAGFFEAFDAGEAHGVKVGHFEAGNIARGAMKHSSSEEAK